MYFRIVVAYLQNDAVSIDILNSPWMLVVKMQAYKILLVVFDIPNTMIIFTMILTIASIAASHAMGKNPSLPTGGSTPKKYFEIFVCAPNTCVCFI